MLARRRDAFLCCSGLEDMARLLGLAAEKLLMLAANPQYNAFFLKKKSGKSRLIEEPRMPLKRIQSCLGDYLQAVYYFDRTPAAFGFMVHPLDDPDKRHVLSNAEKHLGKKYLLNLDLVDYFHAISQPRVEQIMRSPLFNFSKDLSSLIAQLVCHKGRLPMGAPTSPVLSNLATLPMDQDLLYLAEDNHWTYTRYADDLSFSADLPIEKDGVDSIEYVVRMWDFNLNPDKLKYYGPNSKDKSVTGLYVDGDQVALSPEYLPSLESAIAQLEKVLVTQRMVPGGRERPSTWVEEFRRTVFGKLEFARHVLGEEHFWVSRLRGTYYDAIAIPDELLMQSWLEVGYDWDLHDSW